MISMITVKDFTAVPHLEDTKLIGAHPNGIKLSKTKPNVLVGPNGAGKTALLTALSIFTLSNLTGVSSLDDHYVVGRDAESFWHREGWGHDYTFMRGLQVETDHAPAIYYRPSHIPGNELSIAHAMFTGYSREAREYAGRTENRSSGQAAQALLDRVFQTLRGESGVTLKQNNWRFGTNVEDLSADFHAAPYRHQANQLLRRRDKTPMTALPLLLLDEPEQSLDVRSELELWRAIEHTDCTRLQVLVATHSIYPILHPKRFNLIEASTGYLGEVASLL